MAKKKSVGEKNAAKYSSQKSSGNTKYPVKSKHENDFDGELDDTALPEDPDGLYDGNSDEDDEDY